MRGLADTENGGGERRPVSRRWPRYWALVSRQLTIGAFAKQESSDNKFPSVTDEKVADVDENEPLFDPAVGLLGRPGSDEMFGFVPALALGRPCRLNHLQKVNAVEHLMLLARFQTPRVMLNIDKEAKTRGRI